MKLAIIAALLFTALVFARDGGDNCKRDGGCDGDDDDRDVSFENSGSNVKIESKNGTDKLEFEIDTSEWYDIKLKYYSTVDSITEEAKYKIRVRSVIEYADSPTGAAGYQVGEEVQIIDLSQVTFDPIFCNTSTTSIDCFVRTNGVYAGLLGSSVHVGGATFSQDGVIVKPNSAKISFTLDKTRTTGNKLALDIRVVSSTEREAEDDSDEHREGIATIPEGQVSFGSDAFFSWAKTATVNGATVNVIASPLVTSSDSTDTDNDRKRDSGSCNKRDGNCNCKRDGGCDEDKQESSSRVTFSFDVGTPGPIVWDPKIGFVGSSSMIIPSLFLAILLAFL